MFQILSVLTSLFMNTNPAWACMPINPERIVKFGDSSFVQNQIMRRMGCDLPFPGRLPKPFPQKELGLPKLPKPIQPKVQYTETEVPYTVTLETDIVNPSTCGQIEDKYKSYEKSMAQISELTKKMESGHPLTPIEIKKLEKLVVAMPELDKEVRQSVLLTVNWDFRFWFRRSFDRTWFLRLFGISDFKYFTAKGPGLLWDRTGSHQPDFLQIDDSNSQVTVSYHVPMLDFCFGDHFLTLDGKEKKLIHFEGIENLSFPDHQVTPVLKAEWKRDLKEKTQTGVWNIDNYSIWNQIYER